MTIAELYSLHRGDMDTQHSRIHSMLQELASSAISSVEAESEYRLHSLIHYIKLHFADEEQFMTSCRYPQLQAHEAEHARLIEQMEEIERHFAAPDYSFKDLLHSFRDWLERHTALVDEHYRDFCAGNGDRQIIIGNLSFNS